MKTLLAAGLVLAGLISSASAHVCSVTSALDGVNFMTEDAYPVDGDTLRIPTQGASPVTASDNFIAVATLAPFDADSFTLACVAPAGKVITKVTLKLAGNYSIAGGGATAQATGSLTVDGDVIVMTPVAVATPPNQVGKPWAREVSKYVDDASSVAVTVQASLNAAGGGNARPYIRIITAEVSVTLEND